MHGADPPLPLLLHSLELPSEVGGSMRERRGPVPPHGSGLARAQGDPDLVSSLRRRLLLASLVLPPPLRRWSIPQFQVSLVSLPSSPCVSVCQKSSLL